MFDPLQHFLLIVEHGTFTAAARHAHLTQPAMSASIRRLEEMMGARLLDRGPSGATPTAAGAALLPKARAALAAVQDGRRAVAEIASLTAGEVRLAAGATACTYLLPSAIASFRAQHPDLRFLLHESDTAHICDALNRGESDLGIVTRGGTNLERTGLVVESWQHDLLILIAAPTTDPQRAPFVSFHAGSPIRRLVDAHFPEAEVAMALGNIAAVKGNVRAGIGIALVSRAAAARDLALGTLVEVPHPATPLVRELVLVHRGVDRLPPAAGAFRRYLLADPHQGATAPSS